MAAVSQGFTDTTAVLSNTKVQKVRVWSFTSQPSDVYFEVRARVTTAKSAVQSIANGISDTIEALMAAPDYTDVVWAQDVTPGGQLKSIFTVYYTIPELEASGFVEVPIGQFNVDTIAQLVLADAG